MTGLGFHSDELGVRSGIVGIPPGVAVLHELLVQRSTVPESDHAHRTSVLVLLVDIDADRLAEDTLGRESSCIIPEVLSDLPGMRHLRRIDPMEPNGGGLSAMLDLECVAVRNARDDTGDRLSIRTTHPEHDGRTQESRNRQSPPSLSHFFPLSFKLVLICDISRTLLMRKRHEWGTNAPRLTALLLGQGDASVLLVGDLIR